MDYCGLGLSTSATEFSSKAFALAYAMNISTYTDRKSQRQKVDFKKAQRIYDFILSNLDLPDISRTMSDSMVDMYQTLIETIKGIGDTTKRTRDKD